MMNRTILTAVTMSVIVLSLYVNSFAIVDTRAIDDVRSKSVLSQEDLRAIDTFVLDAVTEILRTRAAEFATISKTRAILLSRTESEVENQTQYARQFSESAARHLNTALTEAENLPKARAVKVIVNLLITAEALNDPAMVDLALPRLTHSSAPVGYWATRIVTSEAVAEMLNQSNNNAKARTILQALNQQVGTTSPDSLALMAPFAAPLPMPESVTLLIAIADRRIHDYARGTDTHARLDIMTLKGLCNKIVNDTSRQTQCAQRFAQLYSYVVQRYAKRQPRLGDVQKQALVSVIVEVENKCVGRLLGEPHTGLRRAIEREDMTALLAEHDTLLGSSSQEGRLPRVLRFAYNTPDGGAEQSFPLTLNVSAD